MAAELVQSSELDAYLSGDSEPVFLKRFAAPRLVFIFGISYSAL